MAGSVLGGRWSDHELARLKAANGGICYPEACSQPLVEWQRAHATLDAFEKHHYRCHVSSSMLYSARMGVPTFSSCLRGVRVPLFCRILQHVSVMSEHPMVFTDTLGPSWIYSSTLAYIVDANAGRSSVVVAANSAFRGIFAFVATEIAVPMQVWPHRKPRGAS